MRNKTAGVCVSLTLVMGGCSNTPVRRDARTAETETIARDFMHLQYDLHDLKGAKAKYYSPDFIQHNPEIGNGQRGDQSFIENREKRDPIHFLPMHQWVNKVDHVLVDGKLFAIHHRLYTSAQDHGRVFMDIWRVENGKMVEHWDVIQPIPDAPQNANTQWSNLLPESTRRPQDPTPEAVIREYLNLGLAQGDPRAAAAKYIADDFRQHSPHIADGKQGLIDYLDARARDPAASPRTSSVSHILADGDLVLVTRHVMTDRPGGDFMYADLFRVRGAQITEHWDVIQSVPDESVSGNTMW